VKQLSHEIVSYDGPKRLVRPHLSIYRKYFNILLDIFVLDISCKLVLQVSHAIYQSISVCYHYHHWNRIHYAISLSNI